MRTLDLENQFIELRARGHSLRDIAEQLNVSKSTLSRWEPELAPQIQRLRRLLWEDAEAELGRSLEADMKQLAARIRKWENELDQYQPEYFSIDDVLKVIRECRREYMHRRAILMAERPPKTTLSRAIPPSAPPANSEPRDKTGHSSETTTENPLKTTSSTEPTPDLSHSAASGGANSVEPQISSQPSADPNPSSANAVHDQHQSSHPPACLPAYPLSASPSSADAVHDSSPTQSKIQNPKSKMDDDFLGSVVINRLECAAGIIIKCLQAEAAHRARQSTG